MKKLLVFFVLFIQVSFFVSITSLFGSAYVHVNSETISCNSEISDAQYIDGYMFDVYYDRDVSTAYIQCSISTPAGKNYVEWQPAARTKHALTEIPIHPFRLVTGRTYYLAAFVRFERINNRDIWNGTGRGPYSFDKLLEFAGDGFRWGIGSGWNGLYEIGGDGKFTFDAWYASSVLGSHGPDHIVADQSPYGVRKPYLCEYERWHAVVLGITVQNNENGRVQLWVNGMKLIDHAQYTANSKAYVDNVKLNGTIAQPDYDCPAHKRQVDGIILTDEWQDIVNGGYLTWGPPKAPTQLIIKK